MTAGYVHPDRPNPTGLAEGVRPPLGMIRPAGSPEKNQRDVAQLVEHL